MKEGTVILISKPKDSLYNKILPPAIRWFTECEYHHAAYVGLYNGELYVFESVLNGFKPTKSLNEYIKYIKENDIKVIYFNTDTHWIYDLRQRLFEIHNAPYDFTSLFFYQIIYQLSKKLFTKYPKVKKYFKKFIIKDGIWIGKKGNVAKNSTYCTESIAYILGLWNWEVYTCADFIKEYNEKLIEFN